MDAVYHHSLGYSVRRDKLSTQHNCPPYTTQGAFLIVKEGPYPGLWERWWSDRPNERELWRQEDGGFKFMGFHRINETTFLTLDSEL